MNCYLHPDVAATAFCRFCGNPMCAACQYPAEGTVYCAEHAPESAKVRVSPGVGSTASAGAGAASFLPPANPYMGADPFAAGSGSNSGAQSSGNPYAPPGSSAPPPPPNGLQTSPGLAFLLGLIPGVGAIYNGQYAKGLTHAVIFGLLISLTQAANGMAGQPVLAMCIVAFFFYMPMEAFHTAKKRQLGLRVEEWSGLMSPRRTSYRLPVGPVIVILIGLLFLLQSLHLLAFQLIVRYWPVILILAGLFMLLARFRRIGHYESDAAASDLLEPTREH